MSVEVELERKSSPTKRIKALMEEWMSMAALLFLWVKWILAWIKALTFFCEYEEGVKLKDVIIWKKSETESLIGPWRL